MISRVQLSDDGIMKELRTTQRLWCCVGNRYFVLVEEELVMWALVKKCGFGRRCSISGKGCSFWVEQPHSVKQKCSSNVKIHKVEAPISKAIVQFWGTESAVLGLLCSLMYLQGDVTFGGSSKGTALRMWNIFLSGNVASRPVL